MNFIKGEMMKKNNYEMTTVYNYVRLLDNGLSEKEEKLRSSVERYLYDLNRARENALLLEQLLA